MKNNCYIPIRDFGERGWRFFPATLLISNRADIWLPDGREIDNAADTAGGLFSSKDILSLVESGHVRIAGREQNFMNTAGAINQCGDTIFDRTIRSWVESGRMNERIVIHPQYPGAQIAREELTHYIDSLNNNSRPNRSPHLIAAFQHVDRCKVIQNQSRSISQEIPEITRVRAKFFLSKDSDEILDPDIRETFKQIRSLNTAVQMDYAIATQLVRLSIEHENIKQYQGCDVHFSEPNHATIYSSVARANSLISRESLQPDLYLDKILNILTFLLEQKNIASVDDFRARHEKLKPYRADIWRIAQAADDPLQAISKELEEYISANGTFSQAFGPQGTVQKLSILSVADAIRAAVFSAIEGSISPVGLGSLAIALAPSVASSLTKHQRYDRRIWPVVATMNVDVPSKEELATIVGDLEYFRRRYV